MSGEYFLNISSSQDNVDHVGIESNINSNVNHNENDFCTKSGFLYELTDSNKLTEFWFQLIDKDLFCK